MLLWQKYKQLGTKSRVTMLFRYENIGNGSFEKASDPANAGIPKNLIYSQ